MALLANSALGWATQRQSAMGGRKEKAAQLFAWCFRGRNLFPSRLPLPRPHPPLLALQGSEDAMFSKELDKLGLDRPAASLQRRREAERLGAEVQPHTSRKGDSTRGQNTLKP